MADPELGSDLQSPSKEIKPKYADTFTRVFGLETRGIERVGENERHPPRSNDYTRMFLLWLNSSLTANNVIVGLYGPARYGLGWNNAAMCAALGGILGTMVVGFMSTWGPKSGHRTLVVTRCFLGYYLSKVCCVLNVLTMLGYGMVNVILGGQVLFAVSDGHTAVPVGIVVVAILTWFIATFGMHLFHFYTRYAWIVQLSILFVMVGCAGPIFDTITSPSSANPPGPTTTNSNRLSFFSLCFASAITWAPSSADYFVYFSSSTKQWRMFLSVSSGMGLAMVMTTLLGIGLATGLSTNATWLDASLTSQGSLLVASFTPLHGFGRFCSVVLVLGMVSNNIPCTYSAGLNLQMLGRYGPRIPRPLLTTLEVIVYTACAVVAHGYLREIMENFLPLMSYWIVIWLVIVVEEGCIFRRGKAYDWDVVDNIQRLPMGLAAGASFVIGCVGAVLGMSQSYFVGPIAKSLSGDCDLGMWLALGLTAVCYPGLRLVELRMTGR
ncbi:putative purine-cytosine permease [Aspergillus steynii IBT 23096]|uniref:Putative purine-cytosine permease n=1 Tax=Aspergillus steynii IBT 23096 TaxID=1392250 RepID=A0A2I2FXV4_9EURO|nr:putative purine-cytosine permease [Aspergillus steynii IBT 23096]PLB45465.1 putative purine-cytosine permease [Aspergillus steynii IBT 23096]